MGAPEPQNPGDKSSTKVTVRPQRGGNSVLESQKGLGDRNRMESSPGFLCANGTCCHNPLGYRLLPPILVVPVDFSLSIPSHSADEANEWVGSVLREGRHRVAQGISFLASAAKNVQPRSLPRSENLLVRVPQSNGSFSHFHEIILASLYLAEHSPLIHGHLPQAIQEKARSQP